MTTEEKNALPPLQAVSDEEIADIAMTWASQDVGHSEEFYFNQASAFAQGMKAMRDRTPPSEAETILRELVRVMAIEDLLYTGNPLKNEEYVRLDAEYAQRKPLAITAARKWCADNPVKADNTKNQ